MRMRLTNSFSLVGGIALALVLTKCAVALAADELSSASQQTNLLRNAYLQTLDEYGLPEGFQYIFEAGDDGVKPIVEIAVKEDADGGGRCLSVVSKNGKGRVRVVLPAELAGQPASGKRYLLISWRGRTQGKARIYADVQRRLRSRA
ncbi:MAG: hypothetical protein V2A58_14650, partial [Planctomycetota bacterium]